MFFTNMACPFDNDPVDEGAALLRRELNIRRDGYQTAHRCSSISTQLSF